MLDTLVAAETPEGIVLELRPAGLCARAYAFAIDWLIRVFILLTMTLVAVRGGGLGTVFWTLTLFLLEWLYPVVFELGLSGATPGKRLMGLRVVMDNGLPVTPAASLTRNLLRGADFMPFGFGIAIVCMLIRKDCKRLGDLAAATLVVYRPRTLPRVTFPVVEPVIPVRSLALRDQSALVSLAARATTLTEARLHELAGIAAQVSGDAGKSGPEITQRVLGVAQWLMGRRT